MKGVGGRRLCGQELTPGLLAALRDQDPRVVRRACSALRGLRARGAELHLIELLDGADLKVRDQAWRTLVGLTGLEHPPEREAWPSKDG